MFKKFVLRNVAMLLCVAMLFTSTAKTTYGFIIVKSQPLVNSFLKTDLPDEDGSVIIEIKKEIIGQNYSREGFEFTVTDVTDTGAENVIGTVSTDEGGNARFVLDYEKDDLGNLEEKTFSYIISETNSRIPYMTYAYDQSFTVTLSKDDEGNLVAKASRNEFVFRNIYNPFGELILASFYVSVQKVFSEESDEHSLSGFKFEVFEGENFIREGVTDEYGYADLSFDIDRSGTYIIREADLGEAGMTYDKNELVFEIEIVEDNGFEYVDVKSSSGSIFFENTYKKPQAGIEQGTAVVDIKKTVSGDGEYSPEGFKFRVLDESGKVVGTGTTDSDGEASISFDIFEEGEFTYTVMETDTKIPGMEYDDPQTITFTATEENGEITLSENCFELEFENVYAEPEEPTREVVIDVETTILNNRGSSLSGFEFVITDENGEPVFPTGSERYSDEEGKAEFSVFVPFDEEGEYTFYISQTKHGYQVVDDDLIYDEKVNEVKIRVVENPNGDLYLKVYVNGVETDDPLVKFENRYPGPDEVSVIVGAEKKIRKETHLPIKGETFTFGIYDEDEKTTLQRISINGEGKNNFAALKFTANDIGTHTYTIFEEKGRSKEYSYSEESYTLVVVVGSDIDGKPVIESITLNGEETEEVSAVFTNIYKGQEIEAVKVPIRIEKTVSGDKDSTAPTPDQFEFVIEIDGVKRYVRTNKNGVYEGELEFDSDYAGKEAVIKVSEVNDGKTGITYDKTVYTGKVSVELSEGKLEATVTENSTNGGFVFKFKNTYKKPEVPGPGGSGSIKVPIKIEKTVKVSDDTEMGPSGFKFALKDENGNISKCTTDINGKAVFELSFGKNHIDEVYTYEVYEIDGKIEGMKYDETVYTVEVGVYANGNDVYVDGKHVEEAVLPFVNEYQSDDEGNPATGYQMIIEGIAGIAVSGAVLAALVLTDKRFRKSR